MKTVTNISSLKGYTTENHFPTKIEMHKILSNWKIGAKSTWISIKRKSQAQAFKELREQLRGFFGHNKFKYFAAFHNDSSCKDDSIQVFYTES